MKLIWNIITIAAILELIIHSLSCYQGFQVPTNNWIIQLLNDGIFVIFTGILAGWWS
jgi:hypothetical protein